MVRLGDKLDFGEFSLKEHGSEELFLLVSGSLYWLVLAFVGVND